MEILVSKINHLGDAVSFLPTLRGISDYVPDAKLTVVCTEVGRQVFEGTVPGAHFLTVDYNAVRSYRISWTLWRSLAHSKGKNFSSSLHSYDEPSFPYLLSKILGIPKRIGFASNIAKFQKLLSIKLPWDLSRNVVDINYDLIRFLTNKWDLKPIRTPIYYSSQDFQIIQQYLKSFGFTLKSKFIVIHPGAKLPYREWGRDNYIRLASLIEKEVGLPVVFIGEKTIAHTDWVREITNISIKQLACLLEMSAIFIGNNSGPLHIATAMGTPSVAVQGPTADNWDIHWSEIKYRKVRASTPACIPCEKVGAIPGSCLNQDYPNGCMKEVSIQQVVDAVSSLIGA